MCVCVCVCGWTTVVHDDFGRCSRAQVCGMQMSNDNNAH